MLNKELSHFSESKSGNQISEYICNTFLGKYILNTYSRVVVNALSKKLSLEIARDKKVYTQNYSQGFSKNSLKRRQRLII